MYKLLFYGETWTMQSATYLARKQRKTGQNLTPAQPPQQHHHGGSHQHPRAAGTGDSWPAVQARQIWGQ